MAPYTYLQAQPTTVENVNQEAFTGGEYAQFNDSPRWNNYHHQHNDGSGFSPAPYAISHSPTFNSYGGGAAHGFHLAPPIATRSPTSSNHENVDGMWSDIDRHSRYLSPLSSAPSLSGADSTRSDHPQTPGDLPYWMTSDTYLSPCSEQQGGQSHPAYSPQSPVINGWNPPLPSLNMRDFELSPGVPPQSHLATELHDAIVTNIKSSESFNLADNLKLNDSRPADQEMELDQDKPVLSDERTSESDLPSALPRRRPGATTRRSSTRSRRPTRPATHAGVVQDVNAHIHKPTSSRTKSKAKATRKRRAASLDASSSSKSRTRSFYCPFASFGCESVFPTKNEWKRHTAAQHLQVDFYRCDMGGCSPSHPNQVTIAKGHNDFNRKDLFTQHCRRMHWDECEGLQRSKIKGKEWSSWTSREKGIFESFMEAVRARCLLDGRRPPSKSECGVCGKSFVDADGSKDDDDGDDDDAAAAAAAARDNGNKPKAWEEMMDHVGRHYEKGEHDNRLYQDPGLREWCEENEMGVWINDKYWLTGCEPVVGGEKQEKGGVRKRRTRAARRSSPSLLNDSSPDSPGHPAQHDLDYLGQHLDNHHNGGDADADADSDDTDAEGESD